MNLAQTGFYARRVNTYADLFSTDEPCRHGLTCAEPCMTAVRGIRNRHQNHAYASADYAETQMRPEPGKQSRLWRAEPPRTGAKATWARVPAAQRSRRRHATATRDRSFALLWSDRDAPALRDTGTNETDCGCTAGN